MRRVALQIYLRNITKWRKTYFLVLSLLLNWKCYYTLKYSTYFNDFLYVLIDTKNIILNVLTHNSNKIQLSYFEKVHDFFPVLTNNVFWLLSIPMMLTLYYVQLFQISYIRDHSFNIYWNIRVGAYDSDGKSQQGSILLF